MRRYATTILLMLTLPMGEAWHFWAKDTRVVDWFYAHSQPMPIQWYVKQVADQLSVITYFIAWILYIPNRTNKSTVMAFVLLAVFDTFLYFYNYKTNGYGPAYVWFIGFWLLSRYIITPWPHKLKALP